MATIDVEKLLGEISGEAPCGDDLEYDSAFSELERAAQGKPEQEELLRKLGAKYVVPFVLAQAVRTRSRELFLLTVILLCLGAAWATSQAGLSLALGAFVAGLVISESEYSVQALGEILTQELTEILKRREEQ